MVLGLVELKVVLSPVGLGWPRIRDGAARSLARLDSRRSARVDGLRVPDRSPSSSSWKTVSSIGVGWSTLSDVAPFSRFILLGWFPKKSVIRVVDKLVGKRDLLHPLLITIGEG